MSEHSQLTNAITQETDPFLLLEGQELIDYGSAVDTASLANEAFDLRLDGLNRFSLLAVHGRDILSRRTMRDIPKYLAAHSTFDALLDQAKSQMPPRERFLLDEKKKTRTTKFVESEVYLGLEEAVNYERAVEAAEMANQMLRLRAFSAKELIGLRRKEPRVVGLNSEFRDNLLEGHSMFTALVEDAAALMPPIESFRPSSEIQLLASHEVWSRMTPEQRNHAQIIRDDWLEKFTDYGVTPESIRVLSTIDEQGIENFTLTHIGEGVDFGRDQDQYDYQRAYGEIMVAPSSPYFVICIGDKRYDCRTGMTIGVYDAMVTDAIEQDSNRLKVLRTRLEAFKDYTILTGEQPINDRITTCYAENGSAYLAFVSISCGSNNLRFRPAVKL